MAHRGYALTTVLITMLPSSLTRMDFTSRQSLMLKPDNPFKSRITFSLITEDPELR